MNLTPPCDRVLCRQLDPETRTAFGLELPEQAQEKPLRAIVLAVGEGNRWPEDPLAFERMPLGEHLDRGGSVRTLEVGDEVVLPRYGGTEITTDEGEVVVSILASEILAVVG